MMAGAAEPGTSSGFFNMIPMLAGIGYQWKRSEEKEEEEGQGEGEGEGEGRIGEMSERRWEVVRGK